MENRIFIRCDDHDIPIVINYPETGLGARVAFLSVALPSKCLISLNGVINVKQQFSIPYDQEEMKQNGYVLKETSDGRTELLFTRFFDELEEYRSEAIDDYSNPILICTGKKYPTVDPKISDDFIRDRKRKNADLLMIDDANHTFNAKTGDLTKLNELCDGMIAWLNDHLYP